MMQVRRREDPLRTGSAVLETIFTIGLGTSLLDDLKCIIILPITSYCIRAYYFILEQYYIVCMLMYLFEIVAVHSLDGSVGLSVVVDSGVTDSTV